MRIGLILATVFALVASRAQAQNTASADGLDAYIRKSMAQWQVPGLAIAVVRDGKVELARGYGVRELGKPDKVDADTLFGIASNTKAITAAALGKLVSQGKLDWEALAADHVKALRLDSPYVTESITLRDLLVHRSGYCDPGAMWYTSDDSDAIERLRYQNSDYGFRAQFCYNNMTYLAASRFIADVSGKSWNEYVAQYLFKPLAMNRSTTTAAELTASSDVASPHGMIDGKPAVIQRYWAHNMDIDAPVGGINSSANDMSHWLQMLLADGTFDGQSVVDAKIIKTMESSQIVIPADGEIGREIRAWMPGGKFYTYGLGLFVQDYAGHVLVWHAGDIDGMASALALVPDQNLGIVVMTNMDHANARFGIVNRFLQSTLGSTPHDVGNDLYVAMRNKERKADAARRKLAATRKPHAKPPLALSAYAGNYRDDFDGNARVSVESGRLFLRLGNPDFSGILQHWHDNTFRVAWQNRFYGDKYITFDLDDSGKPSKLRIDSYGLQFDRAADAKPETK
ncbi:MAG: serine hydrolase [Rudaea sp.]